MDGDDDRSDRRAAGARRAARDRRLRHRLLVARLPAAVPGRLGEGRPLVRRRLGDRGARTRRSSPRSSASATRSACASSPRASRPSEQLNALVDARVRPGAGLLLLAAAARRPSFASRCIANVAAAGRPGRAPADRRPRPPARRVAPIERDQAPRPWRRTPSVAASDLLRWAETLSGDRPHRARLHAEPLRAGAVRGGAEGRVRHPRRRDRRGRGRGALRGVALDRRRGRRRLRDAEGRGRGDRRQRARARSCSPSAPTAASGSTRSAGPTSATRRRRSR